MDPKEKKKRIRKARRKRKLIGWKLKTRGRIHDILFPNCYPQHIAEIDYIMNEFKDVDFAYEHLREQMKVDEVFKDEKVKVFEAVFFIQEETLVIGKNNTGWKEAYVKKFLEDQLMEAKRMLENKILNPSKDKEYKKGLNEIIDALENCISQLS